MEVTSSWVCTKVATSKRCSRKNKLEAVLIYEVVPCSSCNNSLSFLSNFSCLGRAKEVILICSSPDTVQDHLCICFRHYRTSDHEVVMCKRYSVTKAHELLKLGCAPQSESHMCMLHTAGFAYCRRCGISNATMSYAVCNLQHTATSVL